MIQEAEVWKLLPPGNFFHNFCDVLQRHSDAPVAYSLWCALGLVATFSGSWDVHVGGLASAPLNWWGLCSGPSGTRKSAVVLSAVRVLDYAAERMKGPHLKLPEGVASEGALIDRLLDTNGVGAMFFPEFATFLSQSSGNKYKSELRNTFMNVSDGGRLASASRKDGNVQKVIEKPRVVALAAVNPAVMEQHTVAADWENGFLSRFAHCYAVRERHLEDPPPAPDASIEHLGDTLWALADLMAQTPRSSFLGPSPEAARCWKSRQDDLKLTTKDTKLTPCVTRAPMIAKKAAMLHAFVGPVAHAAERDPKTQRWGVNQQWCLGVDSIEFGVTIAAWHLRSATQLLSEIIYGPRERQIRDIRTAMSAGASLTRGQLIGLLKPTPTAKELQATLDTMLEARGADGKPWLYSAQTYVSDDPKEQMKADRWYFTTEPPIDTTTGRHYTVFDANGWKA